jgi:hypothetical protein
VGGAVVLENGLTFLNPDASCILCFQHNNSNPKKSGTRGFFNHPSGVEMDSNDRFFVVSGRKYTIFSAQGEFLLELMNVPDPTWGGTGVAFAKDYRSVAVVSRLSSSVFTLQGTLPKDGDRDMMMESTEEFRMRLIRRTQKNQRKFSFTAKDFLGVVERDLAKDLARRTPMLSNHTKLDEAAVAVSESPTRAPGPPEPAVVGFNGRCSVCFQSFPLSSHKPLLKAHAEILHPGKESKCFPNIKFN